MSPIKLLREATAAVPAVRWALGVVGVVAALAIVSALFVDLRIAFVGAIAMFLLMGILVVFARMSTLSSKDVKPAAISFMWFVLLAIFLIAAMMISSVFFNWPVALQKKVFGTTEADRPLSVVVLNYSESMTIDQSIMASLKSSLIEKFNIGTVQLEKKVGEKSNFTHTGKYYYSEDLEMYGELKEYIVSELEENGCRIEALGDYPLDPVKYNAPLGKVEYWINSSC